MAAAEEEEEKEPWEFWRANSSELTGVPMLRFGPPVARAAPPPPCVWFSIVTDDSDVWGSGGVDSSGVFARVRGLTGSHRVSRKRNSRVLPCVLYFLREYPRY